MYKKILVPVALDHNSHLDEALQLAGRLRDPDGHVTLLHVLEAIPAYVASQIPEDVRHHTVDNAHKTLEKLAGNRAGAQVAVVTGHSGRTIIDYAEQHGIDCIVIASHRPGLQDYFLGSTAAHVVRHAPCSVHVLR